MRAAWCPHAGSIRGCPASSRRSHYGPWPANRRIATLAQPNWNVNFAVIFAGRPSQEHCAFFLCRRSCSWECGRSSAQYSLRTGRDSPLNAEITPRGTNGSRAAPEPDPANSRAVAISLAVKHFRGDDSSDLGIVGRASHLDPVVVDDDIRLNVQLDPPARSYLLALNADGSVQLLDPAASSVPPDISARVDYPRDPRSVFGLTEGAGTQAFVLVAARAGLPAYADWPTGRALREYCQEHWGRYGKGHSAEPDRADSIWEFAGGQIRALGPIARGTERQRRPSPTAFSGLCDLLRQAPGIDAIYVVAFPVRPRPAESPATRADESGQPSAPSNLVKESKQ